MLNRVFGIAGALAAGLCAQTSVNLPQRPFALLDAMQIALEQHPSVQIQHQQVEITRGALRVATGQFDMLLQSGLSQDRLNSPLTRAQQANFSQFGVVVSNQAANLTTYDLSAQRQFRNGVAIGPIVKLHRNTDNLSNRLGLNQSNVAFQVIVPLMRGRGRDVVAASENAARSDLHASLYEANHVIAQTLGNAAIQYWNVILAKRHLEIVRNSEARGRTYASDVQTLVEADRVPRGELNQLMANIAGRTAQRVGAEQQLVASQQALAVAMGLGPQEVKELPDPTDALPDWSQDWPPAITSKLVDQFVSEALQRRADLLAARDRQRSAELLLPAARNQLKPSLDFALNSGVGGLWEGTNLANIVGAPFSNVKGLDATARITYTFPPRNNVARGQLAQAEASYQQAGLRQSDVARQIASNVVTSLASVSNNAARLKIAREAVRYYQLALDGENEKFRLGIGSLVDVLTTEDRLTAALSQNWSRRWTTLPQS